MASYWIVVSRGNPELFELMSVAFRGRTGFNVIFDRRGTLAGADGLAAAVEAAAAERRATPTDLGPDEFIIAEQADRGATEREHRHTGPRVPVRRRRTRRAEYRPQARAARPLPASDDCLFTL